MDVDGYDDVSEILCAPPYHLSDDSDYWDSEDGDEYDMDEVVKGSVGSFENR